MITENLPATPSTFTDTATGLAPNGTFYYRVRAFNTAGDSGSSNVASVTIPAAPARPTDAAVTGVTTNQIDLSWTDNAGRTADNYQVLRAVNRGAFVVYAVLPAFNNPPPNVYTWSDTAVNPGTFYEYHIQAVNVSGHNDFTGTNATTLTWAPSGLTATGGTNVVNLAWTAPAGAVSYNVYRGTTTQGEGAAPWATGVTTTSYADATAIKGTTYFYKVTAVNGNVAPQASESAASNEASAAPANAVTPAAPANLTAAPVAANNGAASVALTWTASSGATNYNIYRATSANGEIGPALAIGVAATTYTDKTTAFGVTYYYKVTAVGSGGESLMSGEAKATPLFTVHINFTAQYGGDPVANYLSDVGLAYGARTGGLIYGWNTNNVGNGRNRNASNSPDELHDSLAHLQRSPNLNGYWGLAVPNGTYNVHLIAGDPSAFDSVYRLNVGGTLSGSTVSGGTLAISGTPSSAARWFENTVTVTVTNGVLYVSNAAGSSNNKIDEIDVSQVAPAPSAARLTVPAAPQTLGSSLQSNASTATKAASTFSTDKVSVAQFTNNFSFQRTNSKLEGFAFLLQGAGSDGAGSHGRRA